MVPARYKESHAIYVAWVDYNAPGEPFRFTYTAHHARYQTNVLAPIMWGAGPMPEEARMEAHLLSSQCLSRQEGPDMYCFQISKEALYTREAGPDSVPKPHSGEGEEDGMDPHPDQHRRRPKMIICCDWGLSLFNAAAAAPA